MLKGPRQICNVLHPLCAALSNGHKCRPLKGNRAKIMGWIKQIVVIVSLKCVFQISSPRSKLSDPLNQAVS